MPRILRPSIARRAAAVPLAAALLLVAPPDPRAQSTEPGGITGIVEDESGRPVPYANVLIDDGRGTIADENGHFHFDGVAPGEYDVEIRQVAVENRTLEGVVVRTGEVTSLGRITVLEAVTEIETFKVRGERLVPDRETTAKSRTVDIGAVSQVRPMTEMNDILGTLAGVTRVGDEFSFRGGRTNEIKMVVDGMPVSDSFAGSGGSGTMDVSFASQEGINVLTGGMDAEYGNAQSGVIEVSTREGGERYEGQVKFITDDFGAPDKTYFNYDNISLGFGGPVPFLGESLRFFGSGEGVYQDTYLKTLEQRPARELSLAGHDIAKFRDRQNNAIRGQMKVTYRRPSAKKVSAEYLFSRTENDWYHHAFSRVGYWSQAGRHWWFEPLDSTYTYYNAPAHLSERRSGNEQVKLVYTQPLTDDSYVKVRLARFRNRYRESVADKSPGQYVPFSGGDDERDPENLFHAVTGDFPRFEDRRSDQYTFRADYQNRIGDDEGDSKHEIKTGITFDLYDLRRDLRISPSADNPLGTQPNRYDERALGGVAYVQDRLRYRKTMVMNVGLRFDFFDPGMDAVRVSNFRVLALQKPVKGMSFLERIKAQLSPRLGMSYPISDRDVLHFHYGRFFQLPDLQYLYDYSNNPAAGNSTVGNAFLEPETTISYQFGVRRQLSDRVFLDASVFFKDIFGLVGTEPLEAENETEDNPFASTSYVNKDYGSVRGLELSIDRNFSNHWQGGVTYTLQRASGSSSDVNQGRIVADEGLDREPIKEVPLDWDRTHTANAWLYFSDPGVWGLNFDLSVASGAPATPRRLGQRTVNAEDVNTIRLPPTITLSLLGNKLYSLYGQEFRLFVEGRNLLDRKNVWEDQPTIWPVPDHEYYQEYYTEFGELGGAYNLADTIGSPEDVLIPLNDPRVYGEPRVFRVGLQLEF